ncbi:MAG: acyltransferase [Saprospiraceae bacterium]
MNFSDKKYFPLLDGLRGLAISLILIRHCIKSDNAIIDLMVQKCWIGVDIFFALSGFLITNILLNDKGNKGYFSRFYIRRILRIFPLYYFTLIVVFLIIWYFQLEDQYVFIENWGCFFTYTQNILFAFDNEEHNMLMLFHFWSLAIEEHFYLFWPLLVYFLSKNRLLAVCILLITFSTSLRFYFPRHVNYIFTLTRFDALAAGSIIAIIYVQYHHLILKYLDYVFIVSSLLLAFIMMSSYPLLSPFKYTMVGVFSASLVTYCIIPNKYSKIFNILFDNKLMKTLGKYSYGLYVLHYIIFIYFYQIIGEHSFINDILFFITMFSITYVVYHLLEKPFLKLKKVLAPY